MKLERLALAIPTDMEVFAAAKIVAHESFGVGDLHVEPRADGGHDLYASFGKVLDSGCMVLRVAVAETFDGPKPAQWRTLFDSQPCCPVAWPADRIAGRLRIEGGTLYVTVGYNGIDEDYIANGNPTNENPQTEGNSYGKIVAIELASGAARVVSRGHRNPQGLYISPDGTIFETEHGPRGGDELNRIVPGGNYGWLGVTYGSKYLDASQPTGEFSTFLNREKEHEYEVIDGGDRFYIRSNWKAPNFKLFETPINKISKKDWKEVIPHKTDYYLEDVVVFKDYIVASTKFEGLDQILVKDRAKGTEYFIPFTDKAYTDEPDAQSEYQSKIFLRL